MKKYLFLLIALFPVISAAQTKVTAAEKYIAKYHELAIFEMQSTGIPASITLAQALHESANGTSQLAVKANNHFGVRCSSNWNGKRFYRNGNKKNEVYQLKIRLKSRIFCFYI
jgi:flagellum-specific peptidoglycan hydrolase FlgJ